MKNINLISRLWLTEYDINNKPKDNSVGEITYNLIPNKDSFEEIEFTFETAYFDDVLVPTRSGGLYHKRIECRKPKLDLSFDQAMVRFINKSVTALVIDANGVASLVYPLQYSHKKVVGGTITDYRGYTLELEGKSAIQSLFVKELPELSQIGQSPSID